MFLQCYMWWNSSISLASCSVIFSALSLNLLSKLIFTTWRLVIFAIFIMGNAEPIQCQIIPGKRIKRLFNLQEKSHVMHEESEHEFGQFYRLIWRIYFPGEDVCQFESGVPWRTIVAVVHRGKWLKVRVQDPVVAGVTVEVDNQVPRGVLGVRLLRPAADLGLQVSEGARPSVVDADGAVLEWAVLSPWTGGQSLWRECCWYRVLRVPVTQVLWIYRTCPLIWSKGCVILWHAIHASFWPINKWRHRA